MCAMRSRASVVTPNTPSINLVKEVRGGGVRGKGCCDRCETVVGLVCLTRVCHGGVDRFYWRALRGVRGMLRGVFGLYIYLWLPTVRAMRGIALRRSARRRGRGLWMMCTYEIRGMRGGDNG